MFHIIPVNKFLNKIKFNEDYRLLKYDAVMLVINRRCFEGMFFRHFQGSPKTIRHCKNHTLKQNSWGKFSFRYTLN